jgi:hypothetical protein
MARSLNERGGRQSGGPIGTSAVVANAPPTPFIGEDVKFSVAAGVGLFLLLAAALIGLLYATLPTSVLSGVSDRLVDRRQDIGLAVAATLAGSAALFLIVMAA